MQYEDRSKAGTSAYQLQDTMLTVTKFEYRICSG